MIQALKINIAAAGFSDAGQVIFANLAMIFAIGIAVGFAAKDLLANFFGGLMVYLDRPFAIGDWIRSPDREIEGTVEEIGWRVTCIRTFDKRPIYVPNSVFTQVTVENPSRMLNRRIYETIGVRYDDAAKVRDIITDVSCRNNSSPAPCPQVSFTALNLSRSMNINACSRLPDFAVSMRPVRRRSNSRCKMVKSPSKAKLPANKAMLIPRWRWTAFAI